MQEALRQYYQDYGRHNLPWRQPESDGSFDPYKVMVSEIMLQQTQVARVIPKFNQFLITFPRVTDLAKAELADVLRLWSGLGYNRRAKFLWQAAQQIAVLGEFPRTQKDLVALPGIGPNTAGAIMAYTWNEPVVFIETNVRTVYIHYYFTDQSDVPDQAIKELIETTLDRENTREFYWALMDYGTHLKQTVGNANRQSKSYAKQSAFHGSKRQIRGQVLRNLGFERLTLKQLETQISDERLAVVLADLLNEGLIQKQGTYFHL